MLRFILSAPLACLLATAAHAHPGHGEIGPTHYLTSPEHLLAVLGMVLFAVAITTAWKKAGRSKGKAEA